MVAVTFDPHPMAVLRPEHAPTTLTTVRRRAELLGDAGADAVLAVPFDRDVAAWTPEEFVRPRPRRGPARRRGGRRGQLPLRQPRRRRRRDAARGWGPSTTSPPRASTLDGGPMVWSSTYVRTCLAAGDVAGAAEALGRPYAVRGVVVRGDQRGRELGYPTANVPTDRQARRAGRRRLRRVAAAPRHRGGAARPRSASAPTRPSTASGSAAWRATCSTAPTWSCTAWRSRSTFVERLRGMVAFDSVEALVAQMADDVERAREILGA